MVIDMKEQKQSTVGQLRAFLNGTEEVQFEPLGEDSKRYAFIAEVVRRLRYRYLKRCEKGVVMRYLERTTGYSRQQLTRLVGRVVHGEVLAKRYTAPSKGFPRKFTTRDVALLAELDALHGTLSGPATKCLMQRAVTLFGDTRYARLASISVAHLYNLRRARGYPGSPTTLDQDQGPESRDRAAPGSGTAEAPGVHPHRLRPPGRSGRRQGPVPHQRRGLCHAVRNRRHL
jgi:hypothetical protein